LTMCNRAGGQAKKAKKPRALSAYQFFFKEEVPRLKDLDPDLTHKQAVAQVTHLNRTN
jgi:hypothetical protein